MPFFPAGGGGSTPWLATQMYVSPSGNDNNPGTSWQTPFKHIYNALVALRAAGGGTLFVASGCSVGGPVTGQGIWFRRDRVNITGQPAGFFPAPGFIPLDVPIKIVGCGDSPGVGPFVNPVQTDFDVGVTGGDRLLPRVCVVGMAQQQPFTMENMQGSTADFIGNRIGVDYDRKTNGDVALMTVTNGTRTGTSTVLTVTLPTGLTVTTASRTSNVTTLHIPNPGLPWAPIRVGGHIKVTSTDPNFSSGDKTITAMVGPLAASPTLYWEVSYAETAANVASGPVSGSVVMQSHGCIAGEILDLFSTNAHFTNAPYKVTSATAETITILDEQGDGDRNINNIGTCAHQERCYGQTQMVRFTNCANPVASAGFHGFDIGATQSIVPIIEDCYAGGSADRVTHDPRIQASVYCYGGSDGASGLRIYRSNTNGCEMLHETGASATGYLEVHSLLHEQPSSLSTLPAMRAWGNQFTVVTADDVSNNDGAVVNVADIELTGIPASQAIITRSGPVDGPCMSGDNWRFANVWGAGLASPWRGGPYGSGLHVTTWADGRITGKHPGSARSFGVQQPRFANVIEAPSAWGISGGDPVRTLNVSGPDGNSTATRLVSTAQTLTIIHHDAVDGNTWAVGGHFVVCGWVNAHSTVAMLPSVCFEVLATGITWEESGTGTLLIPAGYNGTGWQFVSAVGTVATVSDSTPNFIVYVAGQAGGTVDYEGVTAFYIPDTVAADDAVEYALTMKAMPRYLAPGMAGTLESTKLIAHGGLGVSASLAKTVGAGSGQLTLTGTGTTYIPIYAADGTTIQGWIAQLQATVNP